jgi:phosphoesterase RecJ-like protein
VDTCRSWFEASSIVNVDHHITNSKFGRWNFVDPAAAASCQVVASILPRLGVPMDPAIASAVLAGIIRDSHGFSTSATSADTFRAAAATLESGAALEEIYRATLLEMPLAAVRLFGRLLHDLRIEDGGRIAWTVLTPEMLDACGAEHADAEGVAEFIARGTGVEVAILLRELDGATRVSLRTGQRVDAAAIAGHFGGGGHTRRAGCTIQQSPEAAIGPLLDACRAQIPA